METLNARECRYILVAIVADEPWRTFKVHELAALLKAESVHIDGRVGKVVSDSLRVAVQRGWVLREGRGRYRLGRVPSTSLRRSQRWRDGVRRGMTYEERSAYSNWRTVDRPKVA